MNAATPVSSDIFRIERMKIPPHLFKCSARLLCRANCDRRARRFALCQEYKGKSELIDWTILLFAEIG